MKISGLPVHIQEVHEPFCKVAGIKEFLDLIHSGKFRGPSPRCGGPAVRSGPRWTAGARARRWGATGRGGHEELDGLLTRVRVAAWRPGDGGE
jgi:hypothetical protein